MLKAVANGNLAALQLLIDRGADVNLGDANSTPLMIAAETSPFIKDPADFVKLLLAHGAKKNAIDSRGRTALQRAIDSKNTAVIDLLK
jgi:ankyrin repeat protein